MCQYPPESSRIHWSGPPASMKWHGKRVMENIPGTFDSRYFSMIAKIIEIVTGKDDLERVAYKEDLGQLDAYLKIRRVWIPKRPTRFLDAATFTREQLAELIKHESKELAGDQFDPWTLDVDGKKRLPAFSSQKRMKAFSAKMSKELNKVFSLGCIEVLLEEITKDLDVDFVDLNLFSQKSWEIGVKK